MTTFDVAVAFVLAQEGGLTNDPNDPGGQTNFGLTKDDTPNPAALTKDQAISIYQSKYWGPSHSDKLPSAVAVMHFDTAVNQGLNAAARLLQTALGVAVDGNIGPVTLGAAAVVDPHKLATEYACLRDFRYVGTANFADFFRGWLRRVIECHALALSL